MTFILLLMVWYSLGLCLTLYTKYQLLSKICHCCSNTKVSSLSDYFGQVNHFSYSDNSRMLSSFSYA